MLIKCKTKCEIGQGAKRRLIPVGTMVESSLFDDKTYKKSSLVHFDTSTLPATPAEKKKKTPDEL